MFHNYTSRKIRHYVLASLLCWFGVHSITVEWLNQTHCVSKSTKNIFSCFVIWPVHTADTICYISYCVDFGHIQRLKMDISRQTLLAVSLRFISFFAWFDQWKFRYSVLPKLLCWFWEILVIENRFKQTHFDSYFMNIHMCCFLIWPLENAYTMC